MFLFDPFGRYLLEGQNLRCREIYLFKYTCCYSYFCLFLSPRRMPYTTQLPFSQLSLGKENNVAHSMYHLQQG